MINVVEHNFVGAAVQLCRLPTDCPHAMNARWSATRRFSADGRRYNMDLATFSRKFAPDCGGRKLAPTCMVFCAGALRPQIPVTVQDGATRRNRSVTAWIQTGDKKAIEETGRHGALPCRIETRIRIISGKNYGIPFADWLSPRA